VDTWYTGLGKYLVSTGTLQTAPEPQSFIEPKYMEMVAKDAKLRAFADDNVFVRPLPMSSETTYSSARKFRGRPRAIGAKTPR
jgi:hypothetical protein